jgi:ATP-dependent helicase/DNAse subunit B
MSIVLITGPANAGKARAVLDCVRGYAGRGEEPLLVVPTRADVERYRRELADGGLVMGVRVERFRGLLAEVVRRAALGGGRPLTPLLRERVLAAVAARAGVSPELAARPGYVRALAGLVAELEVERVTPRRLRGALAAWGGARAEELSVLFEGYHELLAQLGRSDPDLRFALALDALRRDPALWGTTPLLLYGFDDLTRLQLDAVETLGRVVDAPVTLSLSYEPGRVAFADRAGAFQTLLPWVSEHRRLEARADYYAPRARAALHHLERGLFEPAYAVAAQSQLERSVRLLEGGSPRAELELVAAEIRVLLDRGMAPGEIAIAHRSPDAIAELLAEVLEAFGIPFAMSRRLPFGHTALGQALCGLLAAACGEQAGMSEPGRLEDLLAWLRAPGLLERPELADRLEAGARRTGAFSASHARALWEAEQWPLTTLDHVLAAARRGPLALIERTLRELRWLFNAPRRQLAQVLADGPGLEEAGALMGATRALEELAELARAAPRLAPNPEELVGILRGLELDLEMAGGERLVGNLRGLELDLEMAGGERLVGNLRGLDQEPTGGERMGITPGLGPAGEVEVSGAPFTAEAVAVLDPLALRARRVRALFLCGVQANVFPAPARPEPVLSEEERRGLAEASGLRLSAPREALAAERYLLYAAVSRPEELLALSWHTADEDGEPTVPSLFLDDVCDLFSEDLRHARVRRPAGAASWPGSVEGPCMLPPAWAERELALAAPRCSPPALAPLRDARLLEELRAERLWSASSLEAWTGCPTRWFVERLLRARPLDPDPEPLARGGLAHAALRDTLEGLRARFGSARVTPAHLDAARELLHEALARHAEDFPLSVSPERIPGVRRRLEVDLERYLEHAAGSASEGDSPLDPSYLELSFGFPEEEPYLPPLDLGEGIRVRGRIDRIDLAPGGEAVVYDYKGSQAPPADRWVADGRLQMAVYMRAAEQLLQRPVVGGFYQPLAGRDLRARGVLCAEADLQLACVRGDEREQAEVQALLEDTLALARVAAREADAGALQARPGTCAFGDGGCMYPSICRCER